VIMTFIFHSLLDCTCTDPTGYCIMEATLFNGVGLYSQWSSCSRDTFERPVARLGCLFNNPMMVMTESQCGNGVVEGTEECDCNSPEVGQHITLLAF